MSFKRFALNILFLGLLFYGKAQTPITNTPFYKAYARDFYIVNTAEKEGTITPEIAGYLLSDKISNDLKAAIINAISFDILGKENTGILLNYLAEKYHVPRKDIISSDSLTASEIMCVGYLLIMDDYFNTSDALFMLEKAYRKNPEDHSINILYRLVEAHKLYIEDRCKALKYLDYFPDKKFYTDYLLPEAEQIIFDYFNQLKESCN